MADVPKDLQEEIKRLEDMFTVPKAKLKQITDHFVSELTKGEPPVWRACPISDLVQVLPLRAVALCVSST